MTRHIYSLLGEYFEDPSRNARTQRICVAFPNQLAIAQDGQAAPDPWESFLMFLKYCLQGTGYLIERGNHAVTWVNHYDNLMHLMQFNSSTLADKTTSVILQDVDYLVNKIVSERASLNLGQRAVLLEECSQLCKRIDRAREGGSNISPSHKDRIALQKANLTSDQKAEEADTRKTEA